MKEENYSKGRYAETLAGQYLKEKGYIVLERNYSKQYGEIDIVAVKDNTIVFVEVKSKVGDLMGLPEEMLSKQKIRQVRKMADCYLGCRPDYRKKYLRCRIDGICIELKEDLSIKRLSHYEGLE